jgi:hypothetical protein
MPEGIQLALAAGFVVLLLLLRIDVRRFLVAEWDDDVGGPRRWLRRMAWIVAGLGLSLLIFIFHPQPVSVLRLHVGPDRLAALTLGLGYGLLGVAVAVLFGRLRYGELRLPPGGRYPAAIATALAIAIVDEVIFRSVILGTLQSLRLQAWAAILIAALAYVATVRGAGGPMGAGVLIVTFLAGIASGALVVITGGIGASVIGLTITRVALFAVSGRRGRWIPPAQELEPGHEGITRPPEGWAFVPDDRDGPRGVGRIGPG